MNKHIWIAGLAVVAIVLAAGPASAANIKEGKWIFTTTFSAPGMDEAMDEMDDMDPAERAMMERMMGGMKMGRGSGGGMSTTITQCITKDKPVPQGKDDGMKCEEKHRINGNSVHFESTCPNSVSIGDVTYNNDAMRGKIHSRVTSTGEEMDMTISGQYAGPCDGSEAVMSPAKARNLSLGSDLDNSDPAAGSKIKNAFGNLKSMLGK